MADINRQREFERGAAEHEGTQALAESVDQYRAEQQQPQVNAQQQQAQDVQPQPQISPEQVPPGVDVEVVQALQNNPKLRAAVEQEVIKADQARQAYALATQQAAQVAVASILADYPELAGLNASQIPTALQVMQAANPQRHAEAVSHLQRAEQIHKLHEQAKVQQAQIFQAQIAHWSHQQDQAFEQSVAHESPETIKTVKDNLVRVARDAYGLDPNELRQAFSEHPILRAAPFQKLIFSAVKAHLAQEQVAQKKIPASIPNVQRPGVAGDRPSQDEAEAGRAYRKFLQDPNPRSAAEFIMSKRSVRR